MYRCGLDGVACIYQLARKKLTDPGETSVSSRHVAGYVTPVLVAVLPNLMYMRF
jgi:hypothetical protein